MYTTDLLCTQTLLIRGSSNQDVLSCNSCERGDSSTNSLTRAGGRTRSSMTGGMSAESTLTRMHRVTLLFVSCSALLSATVYAATTCSTSEEDHPLRVDIVIRAPPMSRLGELHLLNMAETRPHYSNQIIRSSEFNYRFN